MFPFYNFIAFDDDGNWGWTPGIGKFERDPFRFGAPDTTGFNVAQTGVLATAWERVFTNGMVRVTNLAQTSHHLGFSHEAEQQALITYFTPTGKVLAQYTTWPRAKERVIERKAK